MSDANQPLRQRPAAPATRPSRPAAPVAKLPTANIPPMAERPAIPQGMSLADPGLSGINALRAPIEAAKVQGELRRAKASRLRQTLLPSCLVLGITLPLLAAGWFTLDRFSVVRDNPLGWVIPAALAVTGLLFIGATALLMLKPLPAADGLD